MAEDTNISWADHTFNPWIGCMKVSPACDGCYAAALMGQDGRHKRVEWGEPGKGVGTRSRTAPANWSKVRKWDRDAKAAGTRPFVFCASLADVFDNAVEPQWRTDLFELIRDTPHLVWLLLTKRPQNIVKMVKAVGFMPPNIAFGTTVEDLERKSPNLAALTVAAALRPLFLFVSCEPLLADLGDLSPWMTGDPDTQTCAEGETWSGGFKIGVDGWPKLPAVKWWITGGETDQGGHKARPQHPDWFRSIREQAAAHGLVYHHKQNGEWLPVYDRDLDDPDWRRCPEARHHGERYINLAGGYGFHGERVVFTRRVGKAKAGRLLDGVEHNSRPLVI
jgi:protein gp37